jgi:hypothetical protein
MAVKSWRTRRSLAGVALALFLVSGAAILVVVPGGGVAEPDRRLDVARNFDPRRAPPPWSQRCRVSIAAYEDGSASIYCAGRRRRFGVVDAESGRIRMRTPWKPR